MDALIVEPHNEYAISNIGLVHLKKGDFQNCEAFTSRAIKVIQSFQPETKEFEKDN